jgi:hypothetical protein
MSDLDHNSTSIKYLLGLLSGEKNEVVSKLEKIDPEKLRLLIELINNVERTDEEVVIPNYTRSFLSKLRQ